MARRHGNRRQFICVQRRRTADLMPGTDFTVAGPRGTYNLVQAGLGGQIDLTKNVALYADFTGENSAVQRSYGA